MIVRPKYERMVNKIMESKHGCGICGRKGQRLCPALAGMICTSCCGAKRGSALECPPHCIYFPFGTEAYDLWLKVDGSWMPKAARYIVDAVGRLQFDRVLSKMSSNNGKNKDQWEIALPAAVYYLLSIDRDSEGKTLANRWEEEGWEGLSNDEQYMMKFRRKSLPAIVEIQKVLDTQSMRCTDMLEPERGRFTMIDRSLGRAAIPYSRFLTWLTHYPHFSRPGGGGLMLPHSISHDYLDELKRRVRVKRNESSGKLQFYIAEHFGECCELVTSKLSAFNKRMISSIDLNVCRAVYEVVSDLSEIVGILNSKPEFEPEEREIEEGDPEGTVYYSWLRRGESKEIEASMPAMFRHDDESQGVGGLGTLKLHTNRLVIEMLDRMKFDFAKDMVKRYFGHRVKLSHEKIENLSDKIGEQSEPLEEEDSRTTTPLEKEDEVPIEIQQAVLEQFYRNHYTNFLEDNIPALGGLTPREAAQDPEKRPELIELMKQHIHKMISLSREKGVSISLDWVLEELGLDELL